MRLRRLALFAASILVTSACLSPPRGAAAPGEAGAIDADPYLWLEEVLGERALAWVGERNEATESELTAYPEYTEIRDHTLEVLEADDRLIVPRRRGEWMYHLWRDAKNRRGLYRRTSVASYMAGAPQWEVVLDVDALAAKEGQNWVWKGMTLRRPDYQRGLVRLSIGGSDAVVVREFDIPSRSFVADGFRLPESKGGVGWIDENSVYVDTDFGPGTMTDSGYPRIVKRWRRGTPLAAAETLFEAPQDSVSVGASRSHYGEATLDWLTHGTSFYTSERYLLDGGERVKLPIPHTARVHTLFDGRLLIEAKRDWTIGDTTYAQGTVLSMPLDDLKAGRLTHDVFFAPTETASLTYVTRIRSYVLVVVMDDVRDHLYRFHREGDRWVREEIAFPGHGTIWLSNTDIERDDFMVSHSSFLAPSTLYAIDGATRAMRVLDRAPERFDATPFESSQHFATSADGTRVPYFLVARKGLVRDGTNPTLLYGYGGFRIAQRPRYVGAMGRNWLERGGVYVLANIRGGGEYGPRWHDAALLEKRHKAFEDFEAIAEDLIARGITSPAHLGIRGGSNGGLLVGAAFTRRPELFGAVVCQVPLLDMRRYNRLLAGASWMAEYGDPDDPAQWEFIRTYSPYHNLSPDAEYPRVLFTTSTRDDRVHPAHARKMVARMRAQGHPVLYYENTEGGHAGAANSAQRAHATGLAYAYLLDALRP